MAALCLFASINCDFAEVSEREHNISPKHDHRSPLEFINFEALVIVNSQFLVGGKGEIHTVFLLI